ncbi:MAG: hypothetical protein FWF63_00815 [Fibromonadales bacterium]|nr:hypothetical protein [Fibromonadales bacterium]
MVLLLILLFANISVFAADNVLDIRILRVEFKKEEPDNSLTTGKGTFEKDSEEYWKSHIKFAENYFKKASDNKVSINAEVYPKSKEPYKLNKHIIDYNRSRKKGEKMAEFDSSRAVDYANFVNDVLKLAKQDTANKPLSYSKERAIMIIHAGASRLVDGGTLGSRGANTPGDFIDAYVDTTWGDFWRGFKVEDGDTITSVMVVSETASQDGLYWGINGTITSQIGRELGLPYSYDVVKGYSRLGYFDGMDFAGSNAGNGFFPSLPSAWMRAYKGWASVKEINKKESVEICAAGYDMCGITPQIVKIPINNNEYILLENRQRTYRSDGKISLKMEGGKPVEILVDSLNSLFSKKEPVIESIEETDAALPASGIVAWHVNKWYIDSILSYGAINAWNGDTFKDHQFGISLIEADGILGLGKEFKNGGESVFYFGSGSDLIPHKRKKQSDTTFSIKPSGYANTASTFGGYSGIKITAKVPKDANPEKTFNAFTGDSVINWRALKIPVEIERVGEFAIPIPIDSVPAYAKADTVFKSTPDFTHIPISNNSMYLGNNRLNIVDSNGVPLPNFPAILSNGEPFSYFHSKPIPIALTGKEDSLYILVPTNNGLILAVNSKGKLLSGEFPLAAGTFEYDKPDTLLLHISSDYKYLLAKHRGNISAFRLPNAKAFSAKPTQKANEDKIEEFFVFPNPVRGGKATARFRILNPATSASLDVFDITGHRVFNKDISSVNNGSNQIEGLDFSKLGSDVYSARLTVKFTSGKKKEKWFRIGVIR